MNTFLHTSARTFMKKSFRLNWQSIAVECIMVLLLVLFCSFEIVDTCVQDGSTMTVHFCLFRFFNQINCSMIAHDGSTWDYIVTTIVTNSQLDLLKTVQPSKSISYSGRNMCTFVSVRNKASPSDSDWLQLLQTDWCENLSYKFTLQQIVKMTVQSEKSWFGLVSKVISNTVGDKSLLLSAIPLQEILF